MAVVVGLGNASKEKVDMSTAYIDLPAAYVEQYDLNLANIIEKKRPWVVFGGFSGEDPHLRVTVPAPPHHTTPATPTEPQL